MIRALQALPRIAQVSAVTVAAELGRACPDSAKAKAVNGIRRNRTEQAPSGERLRRGKHHQKMGNAHPYGGGWWRAAAHRHRPWAMELESCASGKRRSVKRSNRLLGKHNIGCERYRKFRRTAGEEIMGSCNDGGGTRVAGFIWADVNPVKQRRREAWQRRGIT